MTDLTAWLLDSGPALRWQVERDLLGEPQHVWESTRVDAVVVPFDAQRAQGSARRRDRDRWAYSVLDAADYFRRAALHDGVRPDPRMADAIDRIRAAEQPDGTWLQAGRQPGRVWFESTSQRVSRRSG